MRRLVIVAVAAALWGCDEPLPCDGVPGTCLNVNLQSAANLGERIDAARFTIEGDGAFRHEHTHMAAPGGQLLPLTVALPLPDEAQRTIRVHADALWQGQLLLSGARTVADLVPGTHRFIFIALSPFGEAAECSNGVQDGGETGVDCGGPCAPCEGGCSDGVKNSGETDVDCGGPCVPCLAGMSCREARDCASDACTAGLCGLGLGLQSLTPDGGPTSGGTEITLRGEQLGGDMELRIGGAPATLMEVSPDGRTARLRLPPGMAGRADVVLSRAGHVRRRPGAFGYYYGQLRFTPQPRLQTGRKPYFVLAGQLNPAVDKKLDLAVVSEDDGTVDLYLGNGDGTFNGGLRYAVFRDGEASPFPIHATLGDFNGDGKPDVATADNRRATVSVLLGNGDGTLQDAVQVALPLGQKRIWPSAVAAGDFNGDGRDDLAVTDAAPEGGEMGAEGRVYVLLARPDGTFLASPAAGYPTGERRADTTLVAARLNDDPHLDLAVAVNATRAVRLLFGRGDGGFQVGTDVPAGGVGPFTIATADMDRDGRLDLVLSCRGSGNVSTLLSSGGGAFRRPRTSAAGGGPYALGLADLDGDTLPDAAVPNGDPMEQLQGEGVTTLLFGDGRGALPRRLRLQTPPIPYGVAVGDFNGDGKPDLATVGATADRLAVFLNESQ